MNASRGRTAVSERANWPTSHDVMFASRWQDHDSETGHVQPNAKLLTEEVRDVQEISNKCHKKLVLLAHILL